MSELETLEQNIERLSAAELKEFRAWFAEFDARAWDMQVKIDSKNRKLDAMISEARAEHAAGKSREL